MLKHPVLLETFNALGIFTPFTEPQHSSLSEAYKGWLAWTSWLCYIYNDTAVIDVNLWVGVSHSGRLTADGRLAVNFCGDLLTRAHHSSVYYFIQDVFFPFLTCPHSTACTICMSDPTTAFGRKFVFYLESGSINSSIKTRRSDHNYGQCIRIKAHISFTSCNGGLE